MRTIPEDDFERAIEGGDSTICPKQHLGLLIFLNGLLSPLLTLACTRVYLPFYIKGFWFFHNYLYPNVIGYVYEHDVEHKGF